MPADLVFVPEVEDDLAEAYAWYEAQRPGLGEEFMTCVEAALRALTRHPAMHALVHESYRRALLRRFPYSIFYEYAAGVITVFAVFHSSRDPNKWRLRLP